MNGSKSPGVGRVVIAVAVIVIVIVAAGGFYLLQSKAPATSESTTTTETTSSATTTSTSGSNSSSSCSVSPSPPLADYASLFKEAPSMTISFTSDGAEGRLAGDYSYDVLYSPTQTGSTFKLNMTQKETSAGNGSETAWITTGGDVVALYALGQNYTGVEAEDLFQVYTGPFELEVPGSNETALYLSSPAVLEVNQSTVELGPTTMTVTTYLSNSTFTVEQCGTQASVSTFDLQVGTLPGTTLQAITYWTIEETIAGEQNSLTAAVTSITAA